MKTSGDLKKLKIVVLMGGLSDEREVSLKTGAAMAAELKKHGHKVTVIDIKKRDISPVIKAKPDLVMIGLHGAYGEDGIMQGILEFHGIPYMGCGVMASALAMNKVKSKEVMKANGIRTPKWQVLKSNEDLENLKINFPFVIKPNDNGSSVGIFVVKNKKEAKEAFKKTAEISRQIFAEEFIKGTEISVPILNNRALPVIEIIPANEFYDYESKYTEGKSTHIIPARIGKSDTKNACEAALKAASVIGCGVYSRVDIIIKNHRPYVIELNTLPGMTPMSLFPESAKAAGISFYDLLCELMKSALEGKK